VAKVAVCHGFPLTLHPMCVPNGCAQPSGWLNDFVGFD
jgi:hypothetical protein